MAKATEEKVVEIKELVILIGKKEITLSVKEAGKLFGALKEIFGREREVIREEHHHHDAWYPYTWPRVTWRGDTGTLPALGQTWMINQDPGTKFTVGNGGTSGFLTVS